MVQLPRERTARKVVLHLRHPEGKPIKTVTVQGKPHTDFDPQQETVTLVPDGETMTVLAEYH